MSTVSVQSDGKGMERVMAVATLRMQINVHLETVKMASFMLDVFFKKKKSKD